MVGCFGMFMLKVRFSLLSSFWSFLRDFFLKFFVFIMLCLEW